MKKLLGILAKNERKQDNFYSLSDSEQDVNEKNIYRYYRFDSDELDCGVPPRGKAEKSPERLPKMSNPISMSSCSLEGDFPRVENTEDFSDSGSLVTVLDNFSSSERERIISESMNENRRGNTFVININNGRYFHIGSQKTININDGNVRNREAKPSVDVQSSKFKDDLRKLLDSDEKLNEVHMSLISLHINDRWKELMKNLGLEETFLEVLEQRNDYNRTLSVYDALQKHLTLFPNTSVGFVVNVLLEIQNVTLVEKLALELKTD